MGGSLEVAFCDDLRESRGLPDVGVSAPSLCDLMASAAGDCDASRLTVEFASCSLPVLAGAGLPLALSSSFILSIPSVARSASFMTAWTAGQQRSRKHSEACELAQHWRLRWRDSLSRRTVSSWLNCAGYRGARLRESASLAWGSTRSGRSRRSDAMRAIQVAAVAI